MPTFTFEPERYTRNLDIVEGYISQGADMLARLYSDPIEKTRGFIIRNIRADGLFPLQDPAVTYLAKEVRGTREFYNGIPAQDGSINYNRYDATFLAYLKRVTDNDLLLAPTLTVYLKPKMKKSIMAEYIVENLKLRKRYKHQMFDLELVGDNDGAAFYNILQTTCKIKNNSVSGAHSSPSTILYVKSAHPTLTGTGRISTSYGNANNEKFLQGNRHYWSPDVAISNIFAIIQNTDYDKLAICLQTYNLHIPTPEEVVDCIRYSTSNYWRNENIMSRILTICSNLTDLERAAFVYLGDLFHLAKHNPHFVRGFILEMARLNTTERVPNPDAILKSLDDYTSSFVNALCFEQVMGKTRDDVKEKFPEDYNILAATAKHVLETIDNYLPLIQGLWQPKMLAPSIAVLPNIVRKAVVTSDTDSSIFTNQYWVAFVLGELKFDGDAFRVGNTTTFLTAQLVRHTLALMSANLGIETKQIHQLTMKNEFYFNIFTLTSSAKHYFAYVNAREGGVFKKPKLEIKGVELRSSNAPDSVMEQVRQYVCFIMDKAMSKSGTMTFKEVFDPIYNVEKDILDDIKTGGYKYLRSMQIKDPNSYVDAEDSSAYQHHLLWCDVFAPKYGMPDAPPYRAVKVSLTVNNRSRLAEWVASIEDQGIRERLSEWIKRTNKTSMNTMMLPEQIIALHGVPEEILAVTDIRRLIYGIVSPFYLILESLGIYMKDKYNSRMVFDFYDEIMGDGQSDSVLMTDTPPGALRDMNEVIRSVDDQEAMEEMDEPDLAEALCGDEFMGY